MLNKPNTLQPLKVMREPITEFMNRVSSPANLSKTLNRLIFDTLLRQDTLLPDELENLHALCDLMLSFQLLSNTSIVIGADA